MFDAAFKAKIQGYKNEPPGSVVAPCKRAPAHLTVKVIHAENHKAFGGVQVSIDGPTPKTGRTDRSTGKVTFHNLDPGGYSARFIPPSMNPPVFEEGDKSRYLAENEAIVALGPAEHNEVILVVRRTKIETSDRLACQRAKDLLVFIDELEFKDKKRLLTGQFCGYAHEDPPGKAKEEADRVSDYLIEKTHGLTQKYPAFICVDYGNFMATRELDTAAANAVALEYAKAGGLVSVSVHVYNPARPIAELSVKDRPKRKEKNPKYPHEDPKNEFVYIDLPKEASNDFDGLFDYRMRVGGVGVQDLWYEQIAQVATGLKVLQNAGIVVLFRPFHEMNGDWFWWGKHEPAKFKAAWRILHRKLTSEHQLHNLLWVYGPNNGTDTSKYYPGNHWVDLIGLDVYTDYVQPTANGVGFDGYDELAQIEKPFGFTEFGPHDAKSAPGTYDYRKFIDGVIQHFPRTTHFLAWYKNWSPANNPNPKKFYTHPWIITREDLPKHVVKP
ncbi:MAG: glycosyl hydrolase [Opitutaceae bacterium]